MEYEETKELLDQYFDINTPSAQSLTGFIHDISCSLMDPDSDDNITRVIMNLKEAIVPTDDMCNTKVKYMGGPVHSLTDAVITVACSLDRIARTLENIAERND